MSEQSSDAIRAFIRGLPKAELHVHLEGVIEPELFLELAAVNRLATVYADAEAVRERLRHARDLATFIEVYTEMLGVLISPDDFERVAISYVERVVAQGVRHVEMFFDPQMHTSRGIPLDVVMQGLLAAQRRAQADHGLAVFFIAAFNRDRSAESAWQHLDLLLKWRELVVGVGLDNLEEPGFPAKFAPLFEHAAALGFRLTTHVDVDVTNTLDHHRDALRLLGVERLDHGLGTLELPEVMESVCERGIGITACPTMLYQELPGRYEDHLERARLLLKAGAKVSLHSDDPGLMRSLYIGDLYQLAWERGGCTRSELLAFARNSFASAWIDPDTQRKHLKAVDSWVAEHAFLEF